MLHADALIMLIVMEDPFLNKVPISEKRGEDHKMWN